MHSSKKIRFVKSMNLYTWPQQGITVPWRVHLLLLGVCIVHGTGGAQFPFLPHQMHWSGTVSPALHSQDRRMQMACNAPLRYLLAIYRKLYEPSVLAPQGLPFCWSGRDSCKTGGVLPRGGIWPTIIPGCSTTTYRCIHCYGDGNNDLLSQLSTVLLCMQKKCQGTAQEGVIWTANITWVFIALWKMVLFVIFST